MQKHLLNIVNTSKEDIDQPHAEFFPTSCMQSSLTDGQIACQHRMNRQDHPVYQSEVPTWPFQHFVSGNKQRGKQIHNAKLAIYFRRRNKHLFYRIARVTSSFGQTNGDLQLKNAEIERMGDKQPNIPPYIIICRFKGSQHKFWSKKNSPVSFFTTNR